ncbi:hypothetical protein MPTK1_8g12490 [Marchantia polymorpha subsp. ruderalis]|uniref:Uncharacterized protein n=1 Tax=Marchantia polymorpha TaxID=3197 RepID=A0A2R6WJV7_MARPO|nr:hypothetical protein MARPO_0083s0071 [Marchantia polymorpha]BBN19655.1 hypothetical protein Mp_8g12490 [Marchantia polymorpha subsp. ruderalis]|eukprot:PTQ34113.1 hypothetical protein MARPO_0083s0071 [Marchantia polymorpha]
MTQLMFWTTGFAAKGCEVHGELNVCYEVGHGCRSSWLQVHCLWIVKFALANAYPIHKAFRPYS